jgi:membrane protein DedA with SNARE-associated domain
MQHLISQYGYLAVFVLMMAESACIPVPSEVIMLFGGALAAGAVAGAHPLLGGIVAAGVLGSVAGSYLSWAVGRYAGQPAFRRWGRRVGIREHEIDRATAWFERHGPVAVLVGRVIPVIRTFISLPAGFADMPAGVFGLYTTLGTIPWTAALAIAGYAIGANWEQVANDFHGPTYVIAALVVIALVVLLVRRRRRNASANVGAVGRAPQPAYGQPGPNSQRSANTQADVYLQPGPYPQSGPYAQQDVYAQSGPYAPPAETRAQPEAYAGPRTSTWGRQDPWATGSWREGQPGRPQQ